MRERLYLSVLQVRENDRWINVAVIDGRDYADSEAFDRACLDVFEQVDDIDLPAQMSTGEIRADEPRSRLPSAADYLASLTGQRARALLAKYHNEDLPADAPAYFAASFESYQVTQFEDWMIFVPGGGYGGQTFLVSDPMVYELRGWETYEEALADARALKAAGATRRPEDPDDDDEDDDDDE